MLGDSSGDLLAGDVGCFGAVLLVARCVPGAVVELEEVERGYGRLGIESAEGRQLAFVGIEPCLQWDAPWMLRR